MTKRLYEACKSGYLLALQMPHDALRLRNQAILCQLRDAIAAYEKRSERDVQEEYEERALIGKRS